MEVVTNLIFREIFYNLEGTINLSRFDGPDTFQCEFTSNSKKVIIRSREDKENNFIIINVIINNEVVASRGYDSECNKNKIGEELETVLRWILD